MTLSGWSDLSSMPHDILLVVSADKIGRCCLAALGPAINEIAILDRSTSIGRVLRLLAHGSLSPLVLAKMTAAEIVRRSPPAQALPSINDNEDLMRIIRERNPRQVILFRAGLIISEGVLAGGTEFFNVHCAKLPGYEGVGAVARALSNGDYEQEACLHRVSGVVDGGEVLRREPFMLDPKMGYRRNEDRAYEAGIKLLADWLRQ